MSLAGRHIGADLLVAAPPSSGGVVAGQPDAQA
jgi:hypothetical protein